MKFLFYNFLMHLKISGGKCFLADDVLFYPQWVKSDKGVTHNLCSSFSSCTGIISDRHPWQARNQREAQALASLPGLPWPLPGGRRWQTFERHRATASSLPAPRQAPRQPHPTNPRCQGGREVPLVADMGTLGERCGFAGLGGRQERREGGIGGKGKGFSWGWSERL